MAVIHTDAVVIGAGPCGLFAVFELGMLNAQCHVIDILDKPGGQCAELYPDKPIYDIPAIPSLTGQQLTANLLEQIAPFDPVFRLNCRAESLEALEDGSWKLTTHTGDEFVTRAVVIAAGAGSFTPRRLPFAEARGYENGKGLSYAVRDADQLAGKRVVIAGGGDSAVDWAIVLAGRAASITLVHRRNEFRAAPGTLAKLQTLIADGTIDFQVGAISALHGQEHLEQVELKSADGSRQLPCDELLAFYGLVASLDEINSFGLTMQNGQIAVDTATFETNLPGVYAIGDIAVYPGKLKLILSGFHEAALMAHHAIKQIRPDARNTFQHSTTVMQVRLSKEKTAC